MSSFYGVWIFYTRIEEWVGLYGGNGYVMSSNGSNKFTFGDESQKVLKVYGVEVAGKRAEI